MWQHWGLVKGFLLRVLPSVVLGKRIYIMSLMPSKHLTQTQRCYLEPF